MRAHPRSILSTTSRSLFKRLPLEAFGRLMVRSLVLKLGGTHQTLVPNNIQRTVTRTSLSFAVYIVFLRKTWRWPVRRTSLSRSRRFLENPDSTSGSKYG